MGLELVLDKESKAPNRELAHVIQDKLKQRGIMIGTDGPDVNVLKIKPPICFTKNNADQLVGAIEQILVEESKGK